MSAIRSLGYLRIEATDTGAWREFGTRMLGMVEGRGPERDAVYLRMDDFPARLVIVPGETDRLLASGWEVGTEDDLVALEQSLDRLTIPARTGSPDELASRRVTRLLRFEDPTGHALEVFYGAALSGRPAVSPYGCRFVTGDLGMGHVVIPAADDEAALAFYTGVLGFRLRDTMAMPPELFGRAAGDDALPWLQPAAPQPRPRADDEQGGDHPPDDRGRDPGRRGPGVGQVRQARGEAQRVARPARERQDGILLRPDAGRVRHRVRHRRLAGR
jgi:3,4-dihydroxy-9,10-secoandrosta-1,3,5(10)-triene-9,17-dione 4,5-dioxygenase